MTTSVIPGEVWTRADMRDALMENDFGAIFRIVRRVSGGMSQHRLGAILDIPQSRISAIENGRHQIETLRLMRRVASALRMPPSARLLLGLKPDVEDGSENSRFDDRDSTLDFQESWSDAIDVVAELWRGDMERREFLVDSLFSSGAFVAPAARWLSVPRVADIATHGSRQIGTSDIETIREFTVTFRSLDNRFGGGRGRSTVIHFLNHEIAPIIRYGRYSDSVARDLFAAVAELTQLAGWMAYDAERHGLAQRYLIQALRLAAIAGDDGLGGEILAGMSHQAIYLANPAIAIDLARSSQESARRSGIRSLLAEAYVLEAHGHALQARPKQCDMALGRAERAFGDADRESEPAWIRYFDAAYLSATTAHCLRDSGRPAQAEPYAERSLDMDQRYVRGRSFNMALLASIHARRGEVERACAIGGEAIGTIRGLDSMRSKRYVRDMRTDLHRYRSVQAVKDFDVTARAVLEPVP